MRSVETWPNWLRWTAVPFVAVFGMFVMSAVTTLFIRFGQAWEGAGPGALSAKFGLDIVGPGLSAFFTVAGARHMAPDAKRVIALIVGLAWIVISAGCLAVDAITRNWESAVVMGSAIIGFAAAIHQAYEESPNVGASVASP